MGADPPDTPYSLDPGVRARRDFLALCAIAWQTVSANGDAYLVEVGEVRVAMEQTLFYVTLRLYDSSSEMVTVELCAPPMMLMREGRPQDSAAVVLDALAGWLNRPAHDRPAILVVGQEETI